MLHSSRVRSTISSAVFDMFLSHSALMVYVSQEYFITVYTQHRIILLRRFKLIFCSRVLFSDYWRIFWPYQYIILFPLNLPHRCLFENVEVSKFLYFLDVLIFQFLSLFLRRHFITLVLLALIFMPYFSPASFFCVIIFSNYIPFTFSPILSIFASFIISSAYVL